MEPRTIANGEYCKDLLIANYNLKELNNSLNKKIDKLEEEILNLKNTISGGIK